MSQGVRASEPDFPKSDLKACPDMCKIHKMSVKRQIKVFEMIVLLMTTKCTHSNPERGQTTLILLYLTSGWYSGVFEFLILLWLFIKSQYNKCDRLTPSFCSSCSGEDQSDQRSSRRWQRQKDRPAIEQSSYKHFTNFYRSAYMCIENVPKSAWKQWFQTISTKFLPVLKSD